MLCYYGADRLQIEGRIFEHDQFVKELKEENERRNPN